MSDPLIRALVVVLAVGGALLVAWMARVFSNRRQRTLDVSWLMSDPGVVVFTKDECPNCAAVLAILKPTGAPVRQIRAEAEPEVFERLAIEGVPVTVVVAAQGRNVAQFAGLPRAALLRKAWRRVGEIPSSRVPGL